MKRYWDDRDMMVPAMQAFDVRIHMEIEREQVTHPIEQYQGW